LLGPLPRIDVVTISVTDLVPMKLELSPAVAAALPEVAREVRALISPDSTDRETTNER